MVAIPSKFVMFQNKTKRLLAMVNTSNGKTSNGSTSDRINLVNFHTHVTKGLFMKVVVLELPFISII